MVIKMKKLLFYYFILFLGITAIFCLYWQKNEIDAQMSNYNEEIVFFDFNGTIKGKYLEASNPIEDVFLYYTLKQNALPFGSNTYALASTKLNAYEIDDKSLTLFTNLNIINEGFFRLLYESYLTQGFINLRIIANNFDILYTDESIFNMEQDLYHLVDINGKRRRLYLLEDDYIKIDYLIINDTNIISYIEKKSDIELHVSNYEVSVDLENDEFNYLFNLIKLNLNGSLYTLNGS